MISLQQIQTYSKISAYCPPSSTSHEFTIYKPIHSSINITRKNNIKYNWYAALLHNDVFLPIHQCMIQYNKYTLVYDVYYLQIDCNLKLQQPFIFIGSFIDYDIAKLVYSIVHRKYELEFTHSNSSDIGDRIIKKLTSELQSESDPEPVSEPSSELEPSLLLAWLKDL